MPHWSHSATLLPNRTLQSLQLRFCHIYAAAPHLTLHLTPPPHLTAASDAAAPHYSCSKPANSRPLLHRSDLHFASPHCADFH
jgi:hypothetical protein